ncbi:MAG: cellulase family glycosylhydrolase [Ignavibacteriaceae bacterium]
MNKYLSIIALLLIVFAVSVKAQLTPQDAVKGMVRGINIGNTMEPPVEGAWDNPPLQERAFDDYKNAGFTSIRIPITWDGHTSITPPYTIDSTWLNRVEQVVNWGLRRGLFIIIDAHHETWIKTWYSDSTVARFDSIWSQIATRFKDKSDSLIFEILNEPNLMTEQHVNELNANVLKIIRQTNPTRIVSFSGYMWSNSDQLVTAAIPDSADKYLIGYYHSYDPYPFGLVGTGTYGTAADINATKAKFDQVTAWSKKNNIPVILDEFGYMNKCDYNSRMCAYATVVDQALSHGVSMFAWDDGGDFPTYNRTTGGFNEIKDILIYTNPESPDGMRISQLSGTSIKVQWHNRNTENDSIVIQRKVGGGSFEYYRKVAPTDSEFIDNTINPGTSYYYRLNIIMKDSIELESYPVMLNAVATSIKLLNVPVRFELSDNYPNPFNPATTIGFSLPKTEHVIMKLYDILGRQVATLVDEERPAGSCGK